MLLKIVETIKKYWKPFALIAGLVVLILSFKSCTKPTVTPTGPLPPGVDKVITIKNGETIIQTKKEEKIIRGGRETVVTIKDDQTINIKVKDKGFGVAPMFGGAVNSTGPKLTLGAELAYYKQLSLIGGIGFDNRLKNTVGFVGAGYTPQLKYMKNTMAWVGVDTGKFVIGGCSWRF